MRQHGNKGAPRRAAGPSRRPVRLERSVSFGRPAKILLGALAAVLLGVILALVLLQPGRDALAPSSSQPLPPTSQVLPASSFLADSAVVSQPPGPDLSFTEEEIAQINALLDEWAQQPTELLVSKDADGNPLETPYRTPAGGYNVSVWFMDIGSGAEYAYNSEYMFYYASMMKAPYVAYLYELAEQGQCDLAEVITVTPGDAARYMANTGVIRTMPLPAPFTVEQLAGYAITDSDTIALKVLLDHYVAEGFVQWARGLGLQDAEALHSVIFGEVCAQDAGLLLQEMYRVMEENPHGGRLRGYMEQASNKMIKSTHPVAHKYGWDKEAYHDMAVVFAPRPYLLVIMTDKWGGSFEEMAMFGTVAEKLESLMETKYAAAGL